MTGRLLLVMLLVIIHLVDSRADPIPEPCHKPEAKNSPVWKLLCEQLLKSISSRSNNNATEVALKGGVDGAVRQTEPKKTVVNVKVLNDPSPQESNSVNSRQHKAFFVNYPALQRVYQEKSNSIRKKHQQQHQQKKQPGKSKPKKPESEIFFIRLPPTPYSYVPGLGYISQPPSFSTASLAGSAKPQRNPFIKLPIDFVSNGKPTAVYRWPQAAAAPPSKQKPSKTHHQKYKPDSPIIKLNRGPYIFDGRPESVYLMKRNPPRRPNRF